MRGTCHADVTCVLTPLRMRTLINFKSLKEDMLLIYVSGRLRLAPAMSSLNGLIYGILFCHGA